MVELEWPQMTIW